MSALLLLLSIVQAGVLDRVAAVVNGEVITLSEIYDQGEAYISQQCGGVPSCVYERELEVLDELIRRELIGQKLKELQVTVSSTDIDRLIDQTVELNKFPSREALRKEVERSGTTWATYRTELRANYKLQIFQGQVLRPRVSVSEDELLDFYVRTARGERKEAVVVEGLGFPVSADTTEEEAAQMRNDTAILVDALNSGSMDYEQAVQRYDLAKVSQAFQGQVFAEGELTPELDRALWSENADSFQLVETDQLLFIVRVAERTTREGDVLPYEQIKEQLRNQLLMDKIAEEEVAWYQRERRVASVEIRIPEP